MSKHHTHPACKRWRGGRGLPGGFRAVMKATLLGTALGYGLFVAGPAYAGGVGWRLYCGDPPHAVPLAYDTLKECREEYEKARQLVTDLCKDYPALEEKLCPYVFKLGSTCICRPEAAPGPK